ncbi:MAG: indolepyruvate ferredoxin oxidoreductase family protein, partial [Haliea sp.]
TNPADECVAEISKAVGAGGVGTFDADTASAQLMGDSIYTNPMLLGYAWQRGWVPLGRESLLRAIELNAVAVDANKAAFAWGRQAANNPSAFGALVKPGQVIEFKKRETLETLVARRVEFLTAYQNAAYAQQYAAFVEKVRQAEAPLEKHLLAESVARYLFKLMAYKDEYEVARLHADTGFVEKVNAMFEGDFKLNYHLAPPMIAKKNAKGQLQKQKFGPWMLTGFKVLSRLKGLRGTPLDIFGRTEERRTERALIAEYRASIDSLLPRLAPDNHAIAVDVARIPEMIKGYGHVKERNLQAARLQWDALMRAVDQPAAQTRHAA